MKNYIQHSVKVMIAITLIALGSACKKSDSPEPPKPEKGKVAIENPALVTALKEQGFTFEGNTLVVNDKVRTTTSLNLSGKQLTDVKGLEAFPVLSEVNLSNNKFAQTFDFGTLPATVKSVNLSGNELYDFKNLATTDYSDNAQEPYKLIRSFDKLVLPATAKYNMDVLPAYVKLAPKSDVQMLNAQGTAEKYTTLREVPDATLLLYMKKHYSSVMNGNKIDLSKRLSSEEANNALMISQAPQYNPNIIDTSEIDNIEGVEYIINNPLLSALVHIQLSTDKKQTIPYIKLGQKVTAFGTVWVDTPNIDFSEAESLTAIQIMNNATVKKIDLSASKAMMQKGVANHNNFSGTAIRFANCSQLEEVILPDVSKAPSPISAYSIAFLNLPALKSTIDLSKLQVVQYIYLGGISAKVIYPTQKFLYYLSRGEKDNTNGTLFFTPTEEIFNRPETKKFVETYIPDKKIGVARFNDAPSLKVYDYLPLYDEDEEDTGRASHIQSKENKADDLFLNLIKREINKQKKLHNK